MKKRLLAILVLLVLAVFALTSCNLFFTPEKPTYKVTFDVDGGSAVETQVITHKETVTKPDAPTKEGHTFDGWYADEKCTTAWDFEKNLITSQTTIYAKWNLNSHTVSFVGAETDGQTVDWGKAPTQPADPTKVGHTFGGWFADEGFQTAFDFTKPIKGDTTVYAKWNINSYTVSFDAEGVASQTVQFGSLATKPTDPTKTGYTFRGWLLGGAAFDFATPITESISLSANWEINKHTITYTDGVDGETVFEDKVFKDVPYGSATPTIAEPTRQGYQFNGWDIDVADTVSGDVTYTATWVLVHEHSYTVKNTSAKYLKTEATCTEPAVYYYSCSQCIAKGSETFQHGAPLGHDMGAWTETKAPTCTETGSEKRDCSRCDHSETRVVDAKGHSYSSVVTAPTCTEDGYTTHTCGDCGHSYTDTPVGKLGHNMGQWTQTKAPTCTDKGTEKRSCTRCSHFETRDVEALKHSFTTYVYNNDATCTEDGTETAKCDRCDETHTRTKANTKLDHTYSTTEKNDTHHWTKCSCGATTTKVAHDFGDWTYANDQHTHTCETAGCGHSVSVKCSGGTATCKDKAVCSTCGNEYGSIDPNGHTWTDGKFLCSNDYCERAYTATLVTNTTELKAGDKIIIVANEYDFALSTQQNSNNRGQAPVTKNGNIVVYGETTQIIVLEAGSAANTFAFKVDDGYLYAAGGTAKNNYLKTTADLTVTSSWTVEISAEGVATIKSADASVVRNTLMYNSSNKIFSCYASGQTEVSIYVINEGMSGIKHEHTYEEKETKPDCTNDGYITKTCACGDIVTEDGDPATNHADAKHTPKVPGCDFDGVNEYWYCSKCETYFSDKEYKNVIEDLDAWKTGEGKIAKHGHSYVDGFCEHCGRDENAKVYEWILVTDATELKADDRIIIVANGYDFALGTTQNSNNRSSTAISKIDNKVIINGDVQIIVLVEGTVDNTFGFQVGEKYLYAASSSSNYLRSGTLNDNASWSIQIDDNGVATIVASGTNTRNTLQYNQSNNLFSCYGGSTQKGVSIYVEREEGYKPAEKYTIKFVDEDGTLISEKIYTEGSTVEIPENPTKAATAQYTYTFAGWDKTVTTVTGDVTYTATYTSVTNKYTVTFVNGEETLQSSEVEYGTVPTYTGKAPTKEATAQYTYTFSGWDKELTAVTGDVTYTAEFSATTNKYVVEFVTNGGSSVASQAVDYNGNATRPEDPTKDGFNFAGWYVDENLEVPFNFSSAITTATTVYAKWSEKEIPKYIVTFKNGDTTLLTIEVEENQIPVYTGETPEKAETAQYTYIFAGWNETLVAATEDATYTAKFTETVRKYTVTFKNGDEVLQTSEIEYGTVPVYAGATPEKTETAQYTYTFAGWDVTPVAVTGNATYTATFTETVRTYTVQFVEADGTVISSETYNYGDTVVAPTPTKEGFTFNGWDKEVATTVTGSATYTATWTKNAADGVLIDGTIIDKTISSNLEYITNSSNYPTPNFYNDGGLQLKYVNQGVSTEKFTVQTSVKVTLYFNALNGNQKSDNANVDAFTVYGLDSNGNVVATATTNTITDKIASVVLEGTGIVSVKVIMTDFYYDGTKCYNLSLGGVKVETAGGETPEPETEHTVNFYDDTVDGSPYASETVKNGETVTAPDNPTREGYTFKHWTLNGVEYDFTAPVTGNIDLVAVWEEVEQPEAPAEKWELVTDTSTLKVGDKIIIVYESETTKCEFSGISNSIGQCADYTDTPAGVWVLIIETGSESGSYALKIEKDNSYVSAPNSNKITTNSAINEYSSWSITIDANGNATIKNVGYTERVIQYNTVDPRFCCYKSTQKSVSIYKLTTTGSGEPEQPEVCEHELTAHGAKAATCTEAGNTAYWYCEVCEKYFSDENAENKIALADTVIAIDANAHNYGAWTSNGNGTHSRACAHNNQHVESESCSGGTATCTEKAICAKCESEYGILKDHKDENKDHACDNGCSVYQGEHKDTNADHVCDYGCNVAIGNCEDADKDHKCDYGCDKTFGTCEDKDSDHDCDYGCDKYFGTHADSNTDHKCDYGCNVAIGNCEDANKDHKCDYGCDATFGEHKDDDKNHTCDYGCSVTIGTCEDADKDHKCDYGCDATFGNHVDGNKDHVCDYGCAESIGTCEDKDLDHDCDYGCSKVYGDHKDDDKNHTCDYGCTESIGTHADSADDTDHVCDYGCGTTLEECVDSNKDHACDNGCDKTFGTCEDTDKDHKCDYGCDATFGTCEDANKDHKCDYGCGKDFGTHADSAEDDDHVCDYGCGTTLEECSDKANDGDHNCDICDEADVTDHTPGADATCTTAQTCTECGTVLVEAHHTDENPKDYTCDACGAELCNHDWFKGETTAPTCTDNGYTTYKCFICNDTKQDDETTATGHDKSPAYTARQEATCTKPGNVEYWTCDSCDTNFSDEACTEKLETTVIPVNGDAHSYGAPAYAVVGGELKLVKTCQHNDEHKEYGEAVKEGTTVAISNEADLKTVLGARYSVKLGADINLTSAIELTTEMDVTIDLNGKTITADWESDGVVDVLWAHGEGIVITITGNGTMRCGDKGVKVCVVSATDGAIVTIMNGTFTSAGSACIYATRGGVIEINGGTFSAAQEYEGNRYLLDINEGEPSGILGTINVYNGTFVNFDPANHTNDGAYTNKVAEGYHSIYNEETKSYTVSEHELTAHGAKAATCTEAGNTAYWSCDCGKYFSDENGENEIEKDSWVISINKENHTGTVVNGGTADVHTKYSCCGTTVSTEHIYTTEKDATYHWTKCDCGHTTAQVAHEHSTPKYDENDHWNECTCGHKANVTAHEHSTTVTSDTHHWTKCACGHETEKVAHVYDKTVANETYKATDATCVEAATYYYSCECGKNERNSEHKFTSGEVDPNGHTWTEGKFLCSNDNCEKVEGWELVTNIDDIQINDTIIIVAKDYNYAISTTQNGNNRGQASIVKGDNSLTLGEGVQIIILEAGNVDGTFAFNTGSGYLYAASSGSNYLRTENTLSDNSSWAITIAEDGTATIIAQGSNTRNTMQYNKDNGLFSCYGSASQKAIVIYVKREGHTARPHTHTYTDEVTKPTCTTDGYTTKTCICGDVQTVAGDPATGHSDTLDVIFGACGSEGYYKHYKCKNSGCNQYFEDANGQTKIEDLDSWKSGTGSYTGDHQYDNDDVCTNCGGSKPSEEESWELVDDVNSIAENDIIVIVWTTSKGTYAISNDNGTSEGPSAIKVTISEGKITDGIVDNIKWNIKITDGSLVIYPNGTTETWLYCTSTNNGVRVGKNDAKAFTIDNDSGYLKHTGTSRYLGIYNSQDARCYTTSTTTNIANQTVAFYKRTTSGGTTEPTEYTVTINYEDESGNAIQGKNSESITVEAGSDPLDLTPYMTIEGYTFEGWKLDDSISQMDELTITDDTTLTAIFAKNAEGGETTEPEHTCDSKCETCGKCTDAECTEDDCTTKCECEATEPEIPSLTEKTYNYTFTAQQFTANETKTLNEVDWTLAGDGGYWGYDATKGQQLGSSKKPYKSLTLTSGSFSNVSKIVINTSGASSVNASFIITVGGKEVSTATKITATATSYTFELPESMSGPIVITYTQSSSKAIYIKSISVDYAE